MFLPHNQPGTNKTTQSQVGQNKQKSSNDDYITFIRNNHNMIEKHFMNEFEHPYR